MITAVLCRHKDGALASCEVSGHAGFAPKGADIICAAVSTVMRTTVAVLEAESLTEQLIFIDNSEHGRLAFRAAEASSAYTEQMIFAADYLQKGLEIIAVEYPKYLKLRVKTVK